MFSVLLWRFCDSVVLLDRLRTYAGFVKLEHTVFSLPLIYAGALLGLDALPTPRLLALILLAAIGGRVTAMGLNRLIDAQIDRRNPRTAMRELPRGAMQPWEGWLVVAIAGIVYFASAAAIAPVCLRLAPIPLALFVVYPYLKRFTAMSHLGLGLAWSMAPLGGWLASVQSLARIWEAGWLWGFSLLWVTGFDIIYATMDEEFDRQAKLYSLPARLGKKKALEVAAILHAAAFAALAVIWKDQMAGSKAALVWLAAIGALFVWQHMLAEKKPEFAFFQLNGLIGFLVFGFVLAGMLKVPGTF